MKIYYITLRQTAEDNNIKINNKTNIHNNNNNSVRTTIVNITYD